MSSNTKIIVLKSKQLIYTGVFVALGIILIVLLFYIFQATGKTEDEASTTEAGSEEVSPTMASYTPGVYSQNISLGGSTVELKVTISDNKVSNISIENLDETVTVMYPLLTPSLEEINSQLENVNSIDEITYSGDSKYTNIIILEGVREVLKIAEIK